MVRLFTFSNPTVFALLSGIFRVRNDGASTKQFPMLPDLTPELHFQTARSGGPGGQNVNKTETKVEVRFKIAASALLSAEQKIRLQQKLAKQLTGEGELVLTSQEFRTQKQNKEAVVKKLHDLLERTLRVPKKRVSTLPTVASVNERLNAKKLVSEKKSTRKLPRDADTDG